MFITILGIDPAFAHMGFARADIDTAVKCILPGSLHLNLVSTEGRDKKEVRRNSDDLRRATELHQAIVAESKGCVVAFAEIPVGSQSARASWSLGIAIGVLAGCPIPILQVSPTEVKLATVGKKTASKKDMIDWATKMYPHANWIRHAGKITQANEHLADAIAVIHAGMKTDAFQQLVALHSASVPARKVRRVIYNGRPL